MKLLFENWREYLTQESLAAYIPGTSERKISKAIALEKALDDPEHKSAWDKIKEEIKETGEAYALLKKSFKQQLTDDEKEALWVQIKDIAKGTALGAMFAAPGGSLLLPVVLKYAGNILKPTAFRD